MGRRTITTTVKKITTPSNLVFEGVVIWSKTDHASEHIGGYAGMTHVANFADSSKMSLVVSSTGVGKYADGKWDVTTFNVAELISRHRERADAAAICDRSTLQSIRRREIGGGTIPSEIRDCKLAQEAQAVKCRRYVEPTFGRRMHGHPAYVEPTPVRCFLLP